MCWALHKATIYVHPSIQNYEIYEVSIPYLYMREPSW